MIYDLSVAVAAQLRARKFSEPVSFGPERQTRRDFAMAIVFERDRDSGDEIGAPVATKIPPGQPPSPYTRHVSGVVHVYARSSQPGAGAQHHEDECDRVCDGVICALYRVLKERRLPLAFVESRMLSAAEIKDRHEHLDQWSGAVTRIRFKVTTLIRDVDGLGAGPLSAEVFDVQPPVVQDASSADPGYPDYDPTVPAGPEPEDEEDP